MAATSNFLVGQRDFKMLCFTRVFIRMSNSPRVLRFKGNCSEYYSNSLMNYKFVTKRKSYGVQLQNVKAYAPCMLPLLHDSEEAVTVEDPHNGLNSWDFNGTCDEGSGGSNKGSSTGLGDQDFPKKIMIAVDVDEGIWFFVYYSCWFSSLYIYSHVHMYISICMFN